MYHYIHGLIAVISYLVCLASFLRVSLKVALFPRLYNRLFTLSMLESLKDTDFRYSSLFAVWYERVHSYGRQKFETFQFWLIVSSGLLTRRCLCEQTITKKIRLATRFSNRSLYVFLEQRRYLKIFFWINCETRRSRDLHNTKINFETVLFISRKRNGWLNY